MSNLIFNFNSIKTKKLKYPKNILGGKGANLAEMGRLGYPVPSGFTISTKVCELFYQNKKNLNNKIKKNINIEIKKIENEIGKKFGDLQNPLLLSVRSGARVSMPGMMDTILNLGLNDKTTKALSDKTSNERFAKDSYRRFIQMYGNVVMGVENYFFEELIDNYKLTKGVLLDTELGPDDWDGLIKNFKNLIFEKTKKIFPKMYINNFLGRYVQYFCRGKAKGQKLIENLIIFLESGEQLLIYNQWFLVIWEMIALQE